MKEIWRDVNGYEGYYQVSNLGRVRSLDRCITVNGKNAHAEYITRRFLKGSIIKPVDVKGYDRNSLCGALKGRRKTAYGFVWKYKEVA